VQNRMLSVPAALTVASMTLLGIGCGGGGGGNDASSQPATSSAQQGGAKTVNNVTIKMGEYFFKPRQSTVPAGKVVITAPNNGKVEHELVLLKTNVDPAKLKTEKDGEVQEDAYSGPGEIPDVEAGETGKTTLNLKPGTYAMICNVPGHYKAGMYGRVTVK
jgi:uncharacterized cupredoxin-like copper-binding protein